MKFLIVASALLVAAKAAVVTPLAVHAAPAFVAAVPLGHHSSQYHSQDAIGQYSYGYTSELSAKHETRSADGQTVGSYSYVDPEGKLQNVHYRSDAVHGFHVSATNLPVGPAPVEVLPEPVKDTQEVVDARARHLEALRRAEEAAKKSSDSIEVKSAIHAHPAIISPAAVVRAAPAVELIRAAPVLAAPSFAYSYGINYAGLYSINSYSLNPQSILTAYATPGHFVAAPIVAEAAPFAGQVSQAAKFPEVPKDLPEVVEARSKHLEAVESIRKDIAKQQQDA